MQLIPENLTRLQTTAFVSNAELSNRNRSELIRYAAKQLAEVALRKLFDECIKTEGDYMGHEGQTLKMDCYLLTPSELHQIIADARAQGERDAVMWRAIK